VIYDLPSSSASRLQLQARRSIPLAEGYESRVGLLPLEAAPRTSCGAMSTLVTSSSMNAYDEDGAVVVDLVRHPKMFATT